MAPVVTRAVPTAVRAIVCLNEILLLDMPAIAR
jgi:hypothetical protein